MRILAASAIVGLMMATPAAAIDFTKPLLQDTGEPFTKCFKLDDAGRCTDTRQLTLGQFVYDALGADPGGKPDDIVIRGGLQIIIRSASSLDLNDAQRDAVKAALFASAAKLGYQPGAIVTALKIIDPAAVKDK